MRVLSYPVTERLDPGVVFAALYGGEQHAVWLDSGKHAETGMSIMGSGTTRLEASVADHTITIDGVSRPGTVFEFLEADLQRRRMPEHPGFALGWVGWFGYELKAQTMEVPPGAHSSHPDATLEFLDRCIVFDHESGAATLLALGDDWDGELLAWRGQVIERLSRLGPDRENRPRPPVPGVPRAVGAPAVAWAHTDAEYLGMIRECQAAIAAGDAYQLCLTTQARVSVTP